MSCTTQALCTTEGGHGKFSFSSVPTNFSFPISHSHFSFLVLLLPPPVFGVVISGSCPWPKRTAGKVRGEHLRPPAHQEGCKGCSHCRVRYHFRELWLFCIKHYWAAVSYIAPHITRPSFFYILLWSRVGSVVPILSSSVGQHRVRKPASDCFATHRLRTNVTW